MTMIAVALGDEKHPNTLHYPIIPISFVIASIFVWLFLIRSRSNSLGRPYKKNHLIVNDDSLKKQTRSKEEEENEHEETTMSKSEMRSSSREKLIVDLNSNPFNVPPPRIHNGIAIDSNSGDFYIFGGIGKYKVLNDTHCFQREECNWIDLNRCQSTQDVCTSTKMKSTKTLGSTSLSHVLQIPRYHFQMNFIHNSLILFGGATSEQKFTDDLLVLDLPKNNKNRTKTSISTTKNNCWKKVDYKATTSKIKDGPQSFPMPRCGHAMCTFDEQTLILFGGMAQDNKYQNDLWLLDTKKVKTAVSARAPTDEINDGSIWTYVTPSGNFWPKGRWNHCLARIGSRIFLLGGQNNFSARINPPNEIEVFERHTRTWKCEVTCGREPILNYIDHDCHYYSSVHAVEKQQKLITVSGCETSHSGIFNRMDVLDVSLIPMCWSTLDFDYHGDWSMVPGLRKNFSSVFDPGSNLLFVFGGEKDHDLTISTSLIVANFSSIFRVD